MYRKCGNMGHNKTTCNAEDDIVNQAVRQMTSVLYCGHMCSTAEVVSQLHCVIIALAGLIEIDSTVDNEDVRSSITMLLFIYQLGVMYVRDHQSPHQSKVDFLDVQDLSENFSFQISASVEDDSRSTIHTLNTILRETSRGVGVPPVYTDPPAPLGHLVLFIGFPEHVIHRSEELFGGSDTLRRFNEIFTASPDFCTILETECRKDGDLICRFPSSDFSSCSICKCLGHSSRGCRSLTPDGLPRRPWGVKIAMCLAKLRDPHSRHRLSGQVFVKMLANMYFCIMSLALGVIRDPIKWMSQARISMERVHGPFDDDLLMLTRIYNDTVFALVQDADCR
jgi:hypothetical protein